MQLLPFPNLSSPPEPITVTAVIGGVEGPCVCALTALSAFIGAERPLEHLVNRVPRPSCALCERAGLLAHITTTGNSGTGGTDPLHPPSPAPRNPLRVSCLTPLPS